MRTTRSCTLVKLCCSTNFTSRRYTHIMSCSLFALSFTMLTGVAQAALNAPANLAATTLSTNQIRLSWTDNSNNEDGFKIQRAPDNNGTAGTYTLITNVPANVT